MDDGQAQKRLLTKLTTAPTTDHYRALPKTTDLPKVPDKPTKLKPKKVKKAAKKGEGAPSTHIADINEFDIGHKDVNGQNCAKCPLKGL